MKQIWLTFFSCLLNSTISSLNKPKSKADLYFQPIYVCSFRNINCVGFYYISIMNMLPQNPPKQTKIFSLPARGSMTRFEILWNIWYFHKGKCPNDFLVFWTGSYTLSPFLKKNLKQTAWPLTRLSGKSTIYSKIHFLITFWGNMENTCILSKRKNKLSYNLKSYWFLGGPTYDFDYDFYYVISFHLETAMIYTP